MIPEDGSQVRPLNHQKNHHCHPFASARKENPSQRALTYRSHPETPTKRDNTVQGISILLILLQVDGQFQLHRLALLALSLADIAQRRSQAEGQVHLNALAPLE